MVVNHSKTLPKLSYHFMILSFLLRDRFVSLAVYPVGPPRVLFPQSCVCSATNSLSTVRDGRSTPSKITISSDPSILSRVSVLGKAPASSGLSSVQDWRSTSSEISISPDLAVPLGIAILVRILARIRIPIRNTVSLRILVKTPASIRIPVRTPTSIRVSLAVRILQWIDGCVIWVSAISPVAGIERGLVQILESVHHGDIWPWSPLEIFSLMRVRCWEGSCGRPRVQHPVPVSNIFYMKVELGLGALLWGRGGLSRTCFFSDALGLRRRGPKKLCGIGSNIWCPIWLAEVLVEVGSGGAIIKKSIGAFAVAGSLAPRDPGLDPKATPPEMYFVSSRVIGPPQLLFFGLSLVVGLFSRFPLSMLRHPLCIVPAPTSPLCSWSLSRSANHACLSASAAVGRSSGCIRSMVFSSEIPISSAWGDTPLILSSGKGHIP